MAGVQVSREDDKYFYLESPAGKELPVAKRGLSKERQDMYRSQIAPMPINGMQSQVPQNDFSGDAAFDLQDPSDRLIMPSQLSRQQAPEMQPDPLMGMSASVGGPVESVPQRPQALGLTQPGLVTASQTVQQDVTPGVELSPTVKKDIQEGFQKRADAAIAQQEAANSFKEGFARANAELNTKLQEVESKYDLIQKNRDEAVSKVQTEYQDLTKQFDEAKVDPNRFYGGSTSKRVMAGLAIALGEIGRAMTGGSTNTALKIINDAIDRDIAAQQSEISRIGQRATMARQMMADIDDRFDDKIAATNMKRAILLDQAERKALELSKNLKTDLEIAQAQDFIGQLQSQKADALAKVEQIEADKATIRTTTQLMSPQALEAKGKGKIGSEDRKRIDNIRGATKAIRDMRAAWESGEKTFSVVGDNRYTEARRRFEEAIGRMQTGAAITKEEEQRFKEMVPTYKDSKEIQELKLNNMMEEMQARAASFGLSFDEENIDPSAVSATFQRAPGR